MRPPKAGQSGPWRVPIRAEDIPEGGQQVHLVADAGIRDAIRSHAGLRGLPRLEANFHIARNGVNGLRVRGRLSATVGQTCVVTLEPLDNDVEEDIDLTFVPSPAVPVAEDPDGPNKVLSEREWDAPESLVDGVVDLGAITTEFLMLGLDPYPRKAGAIFEAPGEAGRNEGPFAVLAELNKGRNDR